MFNRSLEAKMPKLGKPLLSSKINYLTSGGLEKIHLELQFLKTTKRIEVAERIQQARESGNVEENAEYDAALDEQGLVENRIYMLEEALRQAVVADVPRSSETITIGSTVSLEMDNGVVEEYTIVGKYEANPLKKRISNESPIGAVLLGGQVGDEVKVTTPIKSYKCKVLEIK